MKIQKLIYILPIFLIGCKYPIHGTLQVSSEFSLKDRSKHSFQLAPGEHYMEVMRDDTWGKTELKMKLRDNAGKVRKIKIPVPDSTSISAYSGPFQLDSTQTGQSFDLAGNINTVETDAAPEVTSEPCGYGYYYGYYGGKRLVTSHLHKTETHIVADFKTPSGNDTLAQYDGSVTQSHSHIDSIGPCTFP